MYFIFELLMKMFSLSFSMLSFTTQQLITDCKQEYLQLFVLCNNVWVCVSLIYITVNTTELHLSIKTQDESCLLLLFLSTIPSPFCFVFNSMPITHVE